MSEALTRLLCEPLGLVDEAMLKEPARWTRGECQAVQAAIRVMPHGSPERRKANAKVIAWYDLFQFIWDKECIRQMPVTPLPLLEPNGSPVSGGLKALGRALSDLAAECGHIQSVKALQAGLAALGETGLRRDGILGPSTRLAVRRCLVNHGRKSVCSALALGRFHTFVTEAHCGGPSQVAEGVVAPLLEQATAFCARLKPHVLKKTLNTLGRRTFGEGGWRSLPEDGRVCQDTAGAFLKVLGTSGPERVTRALARLLGLPQPPKVLAAFS